MGENTSQSKDLDVLIVGAGFSGLYMLHRLRQLDFSTRVLEEADDVGGTWYWNRYPGARCDIATTDYTFGFDPELEKAWTWSEKYATQPEILAYTQFVAKRYDLRRDIQFGTRVTAARWDADSERWHVRTNKGDNYRCRHFIMATGCLSLPKTPDIAGAERFKGEVYYTSRWPHAGVDFTGKRVAVIGTGSSGIQSIPLIAKQAKQLTVFQRTANYSIPAGNGPISAERRAPLDADLKGYRDSAKISRFGVPCEPTLILGKYATPEVQRERFEAAWEQGELISFINIFADSLIFAESNQIIADRIREKIRSIVKDPETAAALCPNDHPVGSKRLCVDTDYYATYNRANVRLVNLKRTPIETITETGIQLSNEALSFDAIVFATGFDAMTGAIVSVDFTGRDGLTLKEEWAHGPQTYLGLMTRGFPNLFMITGPGSPSVLSNMMVSIEQHVDWIANCLAKLRADGMTTIEPTEIAQAGWAIHNDDCAQITLYPQANSWYMGSNVPGKPRFFLPYIGGVDFYKKACDDVVAQDYLGFRRSGPRGTACRDGVIRSVQPDVTLVLDLVASLNLPPLESMPPEAARNVMLQMNAERPAGPTLGEIRDGSLPGAAGPLPYRLYRPATQGPHPIVVYFHGGGWVLGSHDSDDPMCRDLCQRSDALIISVNYRHAPEARFPAAADDGLAAVRWVAEHAAELGGKPGALAVAGWSAGGNIAAVTCQLAREQGGPSIKGQLLLTPVTDCDMTRPSYIENADGYILTAPLMKWFWDHYADAKDQSHPKASPLRAADLSKLPPAFVVTCQLDPLRDEGIAYAEALSKAGVPTKLVQARGQTHTSLTMVDVVVSGAPYRAQMADALRGFFGTNA
jgi:cation diffusion facilitator CzcD-associated flavoprotein CzcO/acetyl esterase/lipase